MKTRPKAASIPRLEDERIVAAEWTMAPGAETGWHRHERDYVVVYLTSGNLLVEAKQGEVTVPLEKGQVTSREAGVEHNVINANDFEFAFVEIEIKRNRDT